MNRSNVNPVQAGEIKPRRRSWKDDGRSGPANIWNWTRLNRLECPRLNVLPPMDLSFEGLAGIASASLDFMKSLQCACGCVGTDATTFFLKRCATTAFQRHFNS